MIMKKYTRATNVFLIFISLLIMAIPFVYASNKTIKLDENTNIKTSNLPDINDIKFIEIEKAKKGAIQNIKDDSSFIILVKDKLITAKYNATTTVSFGGDEDAEIKDLRVSMKVYIFGYLNNEGSTMLVTKIIISSRAPFQRR